MSALVNPIQSIVSITTSDSVDLAPAPCRAIFVGVAGDVKITTRAGEDVTLVNVAAGVWHPMQATRIWATGTDATDIFAGY